MKYTCTQPTIFEKARVEICAIDIAIILTIKNLLATLENVQTSSQFELKEVKNTEIINTICTTIGGARRGHKLLQFEQIQTIDTLLTQREPYIQAIGQYKIDNTLAIRDENKYQEKMQHWQNQGTNDAEKETLGKVFDAIHEWSCQIQETMKNESIFVS